MHSWVVDGLYVLLELVEHHINLLESRGNNFIWRKRADWFYLKNKVTILDLDKVLNFQGFFKNFALVAKYTVLGSSNLQMVFLFGKREDFFRTNIDHIFLLFLCKLWLKRLINFNNGIISHGTYCNGTPFSVLNSFTFFDNTL